MKMRHRRTILGLAALCSTSVFSGAKARANATELFGDVAFAAGFKCDWIYGATYADSSILKKGEVLSYRADAPPLFLIPEPTTPIPRTPTAADTKYQRSYARKFWEFEEGAHKNYTDDSGRFVAELHAHRFSVSRVQREYSRTALAFSNYNNDGLKASDKTFNTKLVKSVRTNRRGAIELYHNTKNEIRNVAINNGAQYANDTWPHFLLVQNFRRDIDLAVYKTLDFSAKMTLLQSRKLDDWPSGLASAAAPSADFLTYFFLRRKSSPGIGVFFGVMLYSSSGNYAPLFSADQHGQGFFRDDAALYGGRLELNRTKTIRFDVKKLVAKAIALDAANGDGKLESSAEDYTLSVFNIGWEDIGHFQTRLRLSDISLRGTPK